MTKTTNNSFSVEALVAKYRNFVMENTPTTRKRDGHSVVEYSVYSADFQLISHLYKDVKGCDANPKVLDIMSAYIDSFNENALTHGEYAFLCGNFSEFLEYEFMTKKDWKHGCVVVVDYMFKDIASTPIIDLTDVAGMPVKTLQLLKEICVVKEDENLFVSGDECGDIKSLFAKNYEALHSGNKDESWALNTIRYSVRSNGANLAEDVPSNQSQDVVIYFDYDDNFLSGIKRIIRSMHLNGSDKKVSLADAYNMLKQNGKMYIDITRDQLMRGSEMYQVIQKMLVDKVITSILSYQSDDKVFGHMCRCLIVVNKSGSDKITMKAGMAEKSVEVSYNDIDKDMLWPGYYYNECNDNTVPLSDLIDLCKTTKCSSESATTHFVLTQSLENEFVDSGLSEADMYMAEKAMKRLRLEKIEEFKGENFKYTDDDFKKTKNSLIKVMHKIAPCNTPCVLLSSSFHIGYFQTVPSGGVGVSPFLYCLKPKQGITPQYIAALLCNKDIKSQIQRTCECRMSFDDLKYILDKIYVPNHTPIERERYVTSVVMSAYKDLRKEKEQDLTNYTKGIRLRKHSLSQSLSSINALFDAVNTFRKRNFGSMDDNDVVSRVKGFTVADIFERMEKRMPEIMEAVDHLADIDYTFGRVEIINPETFVEGYISSHDKEWINFKGSIDWLRGGNIARFDIMQDGNILVKKGKPIHTFYFPKDALTKIMDNIISNAKEYAFTDKERTNYDLHFSWRMNGTDLVLEIANNGTAIPADRDVKSLLEYGVSSKLHSKGHNGIGCHEIKGIMNRYNGDFEILSTPQDEYTVRYVLTFKSTNSFNTL